MSTQPQLYNRTTAVAVVVANMIGTGVFTSLAYQLIGLSDPFAIIMLWLAGGIIALCGAFCYAEVATRLKESGGEYLYLSKIFHPVVGFTSSWISLFAGFSGAIATSALAIGKYAGPVLGYTVDTNDTSLFRIDKLVAIGALIFLSLIHVRGVKTGGLAQTILTSIKLALIAFFCLAPFFISGSNQGIQSFAPSNKSWELIFSMAFAGSLAWVMFSYSGWNAASYIAGNIEKPRKTIPQALILGTLFVTFIYIFLNMMFLYTTPMDEMNFVKNGFKEDVGNIVATKLFGVDYGLIFSGLFSLALLSTCSSMIIAGPRVLEKMGHDYSFFKSLTVNSKGGTPVIAIVVQGVLSLSMILFSDFESMIQYISIILTFFSVLTVIGLIVLRIKSKGQPDDPSVYKSPLFPIPALIFIAAAVWMILFFATHEDPKERMKLVYGALSLLPGIILYYITVALKKR
ncbi:MAG TPA: amino acid permease [Flavobacteriales bacterium]|nr:amino acid permease [Flavobacteriales bacterium]